MTAETLREAARLMRGRAESSRAFITPADDWWGEDGLCEAFDLLWGEQDAEMPGRREDAEHIASWHPSVALAVALLLENESHAWESQDARDADVDLSVNLARRRLLTDIARAYLGAEVTS